MTKESQSKMLVDVTRHELRALVFWAASGVRMYNCGGYRWIDHVIRKYRRPLSMMSRDTRPDWGKDRQRFDLNQFKDAADKLVSLTYEEAAKIAESMDDSSASMIAAAIRAAMKRKDRK